MTTRAPYTQFRGRLEAGDHMLGTFIKFPSTHSTEIVGAVGFDFVVIDQEHSAFDRTTIDMMVLGARAYNVTPIVRVAEASPSSILSVLDLGAMGVLVPHIDTPEKARDIAAACRYRGGIRGFATTTRAGDFGGASMARHKDRQDAEVTCIAMIEDPHAIEHADDILAVDGIHAVFIGRGDLYSAYEAESMQAPVVRKAAERGHAATVEPTAEAEKAWVDLLLTGVGPALGNTACTPGYYNNEGEGFGDAAKYAVGHPAGALGYLVMK